jgi:dTDP-4-amino-4,6-dideoxygalactose transaminase
LEGLDGRVERRNELVRLFIAEVDGIPGLRFQRVAREDVSTYKDLTLIIDPSTFGLTVDQLATALHADRVDTRRYYHPPVHQQKAYALLRGDRGLPTTETLSASVLTLPLWSHMRDATVTGLARLVQQIHHHAPEIRGELA